MSLWYLCNCRDLYSNWYTSLDEFLVYDYLIDCDIETTFFVTYRSCMTYIYYIPTTHMQSVSSSVWDNFWWVYMQYTYMHACTKPVIYWGSNVPANKPIQKYN